MRYILVSQTENKTTKVCHEDEARKHTESISIEPEVKHVPRVQCPFMAEDHPSMEHHPAHCFVACQTPRPFIASRSSKG